MEERYCVPDMCVDISLERREVEVVSWGIRVLIKGFEEVVVEQRGSTKVLRPSPKA